jgi:hypothetical protein
MPLERKRVELGVTEHLGASFSNREMVRRQQTEITHLEMFEILMEQNRGYRHHTARRIIPSVYHNLPEQ